MKNAIILHGMPDKEEYEKRETGPQSHGHWIPWLKEQLEVAGILAVTPDMPKPYEPEYEAWKRVFEQNPITENMVLVGHSCGAGFIARWLSETKTRVGKVVLVAPWMDPPPRQLTNGFFEVPLSPEAYDRAESITIFWSADDDEDILQSVEHLEKVWPNATVRRFEGRGHFTLDVMKTREFPELLEEVLRTR